MGPILEGARAEVTPDPLRWRRTKRIKKRERGEREREKGDETIRFVLYFHASKMEYEVEANP